MSKENTPTAASLTGPLLVFVSGAPCSGKSTLCAALAAHYNLDHFSLGDELRSLVSATPSGHAARIKTLFSATELDIFRSNLYTGTLGPYHLTPKYVKERVFPAGCNPQNVRILIDGFPRDAQRWLPFKEFAKPFWTPSGRSVLVVLDVERDVALQRFVSRGRPGDVFERRFDEHVRLVPEIVEAMREDGVSVVVVGKEQNGDVEAVVDKLGGFLG